MSRGGESDSRGPAGRDGSGGEDEIDVEDCACFDFFLWKRLFILGKEEGRGEGGECLSRRRKKGAVRRRELHKRTLSASSLPTAMPTPQLTV